MNRTHFNLVILGSGSTAFAAALRAKELGKSSIMIEERMVGGTCVNRGCLPSKNLIEAAKLIHDARNPRYPGLLGADLKCDFRQLIAQKDDLVQQYREKRYKNLIGGQIGIEHGHAEFVDADTVRVGDRRLTADRILIATGSRPVVPTIEGLDSVPWLTSDLLSPNEGMELIELPVSMIIVGGGYIALELGQMFRRFGTEVTLLERSDQLLAHGYEPEIGEALEDVFQKEDVRTVKRVSVISLRPDKNGVALLATVNGVQREFKAERLLLAAGRQPNTDRTGIENCGVRLTDDGAIEVNEFLQTSVPKIFAAGDVIGRETGSQMATPVGSQDGGIAAHNAFAGEKRRRVDRRVIPRTIFTDPQVAVVGMTEEQATAEGHKCWCNTVPMTLVPRAGAIRDTRGIVKMVADKDTQEVLGVSIVGNSALGLATPMSIMVGVGRGAEVGILIRNAEALETLEKVDTIVLDKTGTLTEGKPRLTVIEVAEGIEPGQFLRTAASLEVQSEHPIAKAIVDAAADRKLELLRVTDFASVTGGGVEGRVEGRQVLIGKPLLHSERGTAALDHLLKKAEPLQQQGVTVVFVAIDGRAAGLIGVADPIKTTSTEAIKALHDLKLSVTMLTGDHEGTARSVAGKLGIDQYKAGVEPKDKHEYVANLRQQGQVVAMAGDGINDAPALAAASVGIAMGTGTDVAIESAGVTLVKGDLRGVVKAVNLSRVVMRNIRQNLFFAFIYNALGVPVAAGLLYPAFGLLLSPVIASAAMSLSSVSVVGNALRLRRVKL